MMSPSADTSVGLGAQIHWSDQAVHIRDFSARNPIPNVVKVIKGQYRNIGVSKSVSNELYLHSVRTVSKVLAESIRLKEGKSNKVVVSDQKYSLPLSYSGWFELLSQDGKSIKAIISVQELARFFPQVCLVRENIKAFVLAGTGELSIDRTRVVTAGEVLNLVGEIWVPFSMGKVKARRRVLKCVDSKGEEVFFALDQKGTFSPVAGQNNISGVHTIKGLLDKFRLPLLVRLVHGVIPTKMERGFSGVFRLVNIYSDENAFVCPLKRDTKMVPISTREPLKLVPALNYDKLSVLEDFKLVQKKCEDMLDSYMNSIHILITMPDTAALMKGKSSLQSIDVELNKTPDKKRSEPKLVLSAQKSTEAISEEEEDLLFEEIDGIYQYVREGGVPPPARTRKHKPSGAGNRRVHDDPSVEIKMQQLDLPAEDEEVDPSHYRSSLPRKDSYNWEEPIYEPLDKIREQKRKMAEKTDHSTVTGFDTPPEKAQSSDGSNGNINGIKVEVLTTPAAQMMGFSPLPLSNAKVSAPQLSTTQPSPVELGNPVSSLRQVMKNTSYPDTPQPNSLLLDERSPADKKKAPAPPLPPKRYNSVENNSAPSRATPRKVQSNPDAMYSVTKVKSSGNQGNSYNTSSSSGSSNSAAPLDKKLRHSMSTPAVIRPSPPSAHPPYVAVARVGDYQQHATAATVVVNPAQYTKRANGDTRPKPNHVIDSRHKLHSMYL